MKNVMKEQQKRVGEYLLLKELLGYDSEHGESELGTLLARPVSQVQATIRLTSYCRISFNFCLLQSARVPDTGCKPSPPSSTRRKGR
jgi:hypothetical protein